MVPKAPAHGASDTALTHMQILFLTPQVPYPPRQGTSIRNYHLISRMASRHSVDLLTFMAPGDSLLPTNPLMKICRRIEALPQPQHKTIDRLRYLFTTFLPDMALRLESADMHQMVKSWLNDTQYDIVQFEGIELIQYAKHVDQSTSARLFDDHNCEYVLQLRNALTDLRRPARWHAAAYSLVQWAKLRSYEANACSSSDVVMAVSKPDKVGLTKIAPKSSIYVAPNGIDLAPYAQSLKDAEVPSSTNSARFTLLFTGKMDYRPNIDAVLWFANEVLPYLVAVESEILFQVVGMNPHRRLDSLRHNPNIEITGTVPDMLPYLFAAHVFIIPMRVGGGTRFKALEAMAARKAIVSTPLGVEGIGVSDQKELLLATKADEFAVAVLRLLADQRSGAPLSKQLGAAAYDFVAANYTWDRIIPTIESIYTRLRENIAPIQTRLLSPIVTDAP